MLAAGDSIPDVKLVDESGAVLSLASLLDRPIVLFFYPKDNTPGCTFEACSFRDEYETFVERGADVIGVSSDDARSHAAFSKKNGLPFRLMTDPNGLARRAFGVAKTFGVLPGRATFLIDTTGKVRYSFDSQFTPLKHAHNALEALRTLNPSTSSA